MKEKLFKDVLTIIRRAFHSDDFIPLHVPVFTGNEKKYLADCIDSGFVSSVGQYVNEFEEMFKTYVGSGFAVAAVNGTAALQVALRLVGLERDEEVLTQALSFVGTANAISYCCAQPVFLDVERSTLGMDPEKLEEYLRRHTFRGDNGYRYNKNTKKRIAACVPVHIFGHPCRVDAVAEVCAAYGIPVVEDAAESIGSLYKGKHTGRFGRIGIFSFNGNKTMTTGGGGMLVTDDKELALRAKHITTTAKVPHPWEYVHDEVGYNFRMPNINAALGCAQLEQLDAYLKNKRQLAEIYRESFKDLPFTYVSEPADCRSNYWLNAIILGDLTERNEFLKYSNDNGVMTRPCWRLLNTLPMYKRCEVFRIDEAQWLEHRVVNIPSSVRTPG